MKKSLTAERRNEIAKILMKEGSIKVGDLSKRFGVSTETIRKDIIYLDDEGIAEKSFGGAIARSELVEQTIDEKESAHSKEKSDIALKAISFIRPNSSILLDAGSTTKAIAKQLRLQSGLKIFTNSISIAAIIAESDNELFMIGGRVRRSSKAAVGEWAENALSQVHIDTAFLGSDDFQGLPGPSAVSYSETQFKKWAVESCSQVYTVVDSSKFLSNGLFAYADWEEINGIITDQGAPESLIEDLRKKTDVYLV